MARCRFSVRKSQGAKGDIVSVHPVSPEGWRKAVKYAEDAAKGRTDSMVLLACTEGAFILVGCSDGRCEPIAVKTEFMPDVALAGRKKRRR